jgi:hypothetical protein
MKTSPITSLVGFHVSPCFEFKSKYKNSMDNSVPLDHYPKTKIILAKKANNVQNFATWILLAPTIFKK